MKHLLAIVALVIFFSSCDQNTKRELPKGRKAIIPEKDYPKDREAPIDIPPPPAPYTGPQKLCFEMELGNNSNERTWMHVTLDDNDSMRGVLHYKFSDKPARDGTIEGLKEGALIEMNFAYTDSGKSKIEQLVLKFDGDKVYKKSGPQVEDNGILVLENPAKATFQLFLLQTECK